MTDHSHVMGFSELINRLGIYPSYPRRYGDVYNNKCDPHALVVSYLAC